jgi:hypothetical protein
LVAVAIAAFLVLPAPYKVGQRTLTAEAVSNIDMRPFSVTRGDSDNPPPTGQFAGILRRTRSQLNVILPIGAEEGDYKVRLMDDNRQPVVPSTNVTALFTDHLVRFKVSFDLANVPPGRYVLASRRDGGGWMTAPVLVR